MRADGSVPLSPEDTELASKRTELAALEGDLAQRELDLATLRSTLRAFETDYLRTVGAAYAELDELVAQISEAEASRRPLDAQAHERAPSDRSRANASSQAATAALSVLDGEISPEARERLRSLYRDIAKRLHPDLAVDERSRENRHRLMAEVNAAYAQGDQPKLRNILEAWMSSPESVTGDGTGADLVRTLRKIHQVRLRLAAIEKDIAVLEESELHVLREEAIAARQRGEDPLAEMVAHVSARSTLARERLEAIRAHGR